MNNFEENRKVKPLGRDEKLIVEMRKNGKVKLRSQLFCARSQEEQGGYVECSASYGCPINLNRWYVEGEGPNENIAREDLQRQRDISAIESAKRNHPHLKFITPSTIKEYTLTSCPVGIDNPTRRG